MKFDAFTKNGFVRIIATSLMLSVYVITIILNYASRGYTVGNLLATVVFTLSLSAFCIFAKLKNHPPLLIGARGWLLASMPMIVLAIILSATDVQFSGFFGELVGYAVFIFISPYFGFFYLIEIDWIHADTVLGIIGIIISVLILFIPWWAQKAVDRRRLLKKYR